MQQQHADMLACALISKVESAAAHKQEFAVRLFFCRNDSGVLHPRYGVVKVRRPNLHQGLQTVAIFDVIAIVAFERKVHPSPFFYRHIVTKNVFLIVEHPQINGLTPSVAIRQELLQCGRHGLLIPLSNTKNPFLQWPFMPSCINNKSKIVGPLHNRRWP
jgi:hypothetical protein